MFDFWKEVVINDTDRFSVELGLDGAEVLRVKGVADYSTDGIVGGKIYHTAPVKTGVPAEVSLKSVTAPAAGNILQLVLKIAQVGKADGEYALPWTSGKPVILEADTVANIIAKAAKVDGLSASGSVITCGDANMIISKAVVKELKPDGDLVKETVLNPDNAKRKSTVGSGKWLIENLRFPTTANRSYTAEHADELPQKDGWYHQYAFEYAVPTRGLHGQGTVGQEMTSVTHHVFYVLASEPYSQPFTFERGGAKVEDIEPGKVITEAKNVYTDVKEEAPSYVVDDDDLNIEYDSDSM